jgi:molybdopterin biosynthesis enzyme
MVKKNNSLTNFLRVRFLPNNTETFSVYENQDSSMQKILKESDGIWIRKPGEIRKKKNDACNIVVLNNSFIQEI